MFTKQAAISTVTMTASKWSKHRIFGERHWSSLSPSFRSTLDPGWHHETLVPRPKGKRSLRWSVDTRCSDLWTLWSANHSCLKRSQEILNALGSKMHRTKAKREAGLGKNTFHPRWPWGTAAHSEQLQQQAACATLAHRAILPCYLHVSIVTRVSSMFSSSSSAGGCGVRDLYNDSRVWN